MKNLVIILLIVIAASLEVRLQVEAPPDFRSVVESILKEKYRTDLAHVCPVDTDPVAARVFRDYGAIFVSNNGGQIPGSCIFDTEAHVYNFQQGMKPDVATIHGVEIMLQKAAMAALLDARQEALGKGLDISPRGGSEAASRSYERTVSLWNSRFAPALSYWTAKGRIKRDEAEMARRSPIRRQVEMVLAWEQKGLFFSKDLSKSILFSVAAPGASQHIFMLAFDVDQFANKQVRQILAKHGWFQTVKSDLPHFTFLGVKESDLSSLGLIPVVSGGQTFWIPNM
jgi:hypothetical protein